MKPKLSKQDRVRAVKQLLGGKSASEITAEFKISRALLYRLRKKYLTSDKNDQSLNLKTPSAERAHHPKLGSDRRLQLVKEVIEGKLPVSKACKKYGISRTVFYRLKKRYLLASPKGRELALADHSSRPKRIARLTPQRAEEEILVLARVHPEYSTHKIAALLKNTYGQPLVSNKGAQNIFKRNNLSTYEQRLDYSRLTEEAWQPRIKFSAIPSIPIKVWRLLYAPFATIPKLGWLLTRGQLLLIGVLFISFYFYKVLQAIVQSPYGNPVGVTFAATSLTIGIFFFLYSLKYYASAFLVLRLAQSGASQNPFDFAQGKQSQNVILSIAKNLLGSFGLRPQDDRTPRVNPLLVNLDKVNLTRKPFVSIHVALYNERRVVERLIKACTSQEWDGYELIIADDSTDETTEIAIETLKSGGWQVIKSVIANTSMSLRDHPSTSLRINSVAKQSIPGIATSPAAPDPRNDSNRDHEIFVATKSNAPTVKLIHRFSRAGFKGGALQEALLNTDPRAAYITIFDADFIPYPDTLEQFLKSFQEVCGGLDKVKETKIAAVQGYQWHVLNKSQTWVTRGVRTEYAGSYVIERAGEEIYQGLKQISGSVYCIRTDILRKFGWGTSITEDFELTLRLYEAGYKVVFTPYIQAPAEAVSTVKRLIRQRMRWAEGASHNVRLMFGKMMRSPNLTKTEKFEFLYLSPYYLQAAFFIVGTLTWFVAEAVMGSRLPFWTAAFGWSLVFTNMISLPLMNIIGLFLEESDERDYVGILSFVALSYIVVPFQAYAAIKGFLEKEEGTWFRTPKSGAVTDAFGRSTFAKFFGGILGRPAVATSDLRFKIEDLRANIHKSYLVNHKSGSQSALVPLTASSTSTRLSAYNTLSVSSFHPSTSLRQNSGQALRTFGIRPRRMRFVSRSVLAGLLILVVTFNYFAIFVPSTSAAAPDPTIEQQINIIDQAYAASNTDANYLPSDNSLGIIKWDGTKYNGESVYFEAVIINNGDGTTYAALYTTGGTQVSASVVSDSGGSYIRVRTASPITLTDGTDYTVRIRNTCSIACTNGTIKAARLIVVQTSASGITDTQTQVEVGNKQSTTGTSYADLTDKKIYRYTGGNWSPTPTVNFEASLKATSTTTNVPFTTAATTTGWEVPTGITSLTVRVWGGGGGSAAGGDNDVGGTGGGGGFVQDTISVSAGQLYTIVVGGGGGLGAKGSGALLDGAGGGGAGYSAFTRESDSTILLIGGGGGGGGSGSEAGDDGGDGGGGGTNTTSGVTGGRGTGGASGGCGGVGGSSSGIGAGGACLSSSTDGSPGVNNTGGAGASGGSDSTGGSAGSPGTGGAGGNGGGEDLPGGGGGGGGRYGAGGGEAGNATDDKAAGGGGGGSGLCQDGTCGSEAAGNNTSPGNTADRTTYCSSTSGDGGAEAAKDTNGNAGVAGCVVISYTLSSATAYAALYTTGGSVVSGSEVSTTSTSFVRVVTGSAITLSDGIDYVVRIKVAGGTASIANAKITLDQTAGGGITALETVHQYINTMKANGTGSYILQDFDNEFNPANWFGGTFNYYFEATIKMAGSGSVKAQLYNVTGSDAIDTSTNSQITTTSTSYERQISADLSGNSDWPSAARTLDTQIAGVPLDAAVNVASSWLVVKVSSLQIPELVIWVLPLALFLPFIVKKRFLGERRSVAIKAVDEN